MARVHRGVWLAAGTAALVLVGGSVTAQGPVSPLIDAARRSDHQAMQAALADGAAVNATQPDGSTALHWVVHHEDLDGLVLLLAADPDVNAANDVGMTPLLMAARAGHGTAVRRLLAAGADASRALDNGETPLMAAARAGSLEAVEALVAEGTDVDATEHTRSQTALMWAAANRRPAVTRALLDAGADPGLRSQVRRRVFNMGGSRSAGSASPGISLEEVVEGGSTALLFAARSGDVESAGMLLDAGADVNERGADGNPALLVAVHSGHASVALLLLERGADPQAAPLGYTALHAAVLRGGLRDRAARNDDPAAGVPLVHALLAAGADPNATLARGTPVRRWSHDFAFMARWQGATPYWLAAMFLEVDLMRVLAAGGADPRRPSADGTTPLMAAAGHGYSRGGGSAFIKDRRDFSSYNPVASAEQGSRIPAVEEAGARAAVATALELGADVDAANQAGDTALHAAASHGMDSVVARLLDEGADANLANARGETPQDVAVYAQGIAGDRFVRESTVALLTAAGGGPSTGPAVPSPDADPAAAVPSAPVNPIAATPASRAAGADTYRRLCAACHGETGRGDGALATATAAYGTRPPNLVDDVWQHGGSDGEIFLVIRDGIGPDYAMGGYGNRLSEEELWHLVNYLVSLR